MDIFQAALSIDLATIVGDFSAVKVDAVHNHNTVCPICDHGHRTGCFGLYGSKRKQGLDRFKCFSCGAQGDSIDFVMTIRKLASRADAAKVICDRYGLAYDEPKLPSGLKEYSEALLFIARLFQYYLSVCPDPHYFSKRGIPEDVQKDYLLGYCPVFFTDKAGKLISFRDVLMSKYNDELFVDSLGVVNKQGDCIFSGRYVFPIKDSGGRIVGFSGRSLDPSLPKYVNSPETTFFRKSNLLFNFDKAKLYPKVYVVEGYMDALSLISVGIDNVVAAMGTAFGPNHLRFLQGKDIILALDNDEAGRKRMLDLIQNNRKVRFHVVREFEHKDFNEALCCGAPVVMFAVDLDTGPEFLIHRLAHTLDLSTLDGRRGLWIALASLIGADNPKFYDRYPVNTLYTPFDFDYYWKVCIRYVKKLKGGFTHVK